MINVVARAAVRVGSEAAAAAASDRDMAECGRDLWSRGQAQETSASEWCRPPPPPAAPSPRNLLHVARPLPLPGIVSDLMTSRLSLCRIRRDTNYVGAARRPLAQFCPATNYARAATRGWWPPKRCYRARPVVAASPTGEPGIRGFRAPAAPANIWKSHLQDTPARRGADEFMCVESSGCVAE